MKILQNLFILEKLRKEKINACKYPSIVDKVKR